MSDEKERAGLGRVIYSYDDRTEEEVSQEAEEDERAVEEAVEESFPASDPPGFNKGVATDST